MKERNETKVKVIPLGGLDKIGMNITAFEFEDSIIIVDCGIAFPEDDMLGIDLIIPDFSYILENKEKIKGLFITHGHEDHIGAIPYLVREMGLTIYATKLTHGLIERKLKEHKLMRKAKRKVVKHGQTITAGGFRVEFIKTNHSIADASALAIYSKAGIIVHTGDFKIDYTPLFGDSIDLTRFAELGKKGVLALMCDSTNAERSGFTPSEVKVAATFNTLFEENKKNRILVATFASNVDRVHQIIDVAHKFDRKVVVQGRSMVNIIQVASDLGYINIPKHTLIEPEEMKNYSDERLVIITTGSQGETMAGLSRMADGSHRVIHIKPGDQVVFSSSPIPGNEKAVSRVINELAQKGADIIYKDTHVSGHACREELKLIYSLVKPQYALPVHGEYRHLKAQENIAREIGIQKENIFILHGGEVLELSEAKAEKTGVVKAGGIFVDGLGVGDVGNIVLKDRQSLSENGVIIVVVGFDKSNGHVVSGPNVISRGFVYIRESDELLKTLRNIVQKSLTKCEEKHITQWSDMKRMMKEDIDTYLWKEMKRVPVLLPIFVQV